MCRSSTSTRTNTNTSETSNNMTERPTVLVTGGCGYIGSHTIVLLLEQNYNVVVVDNLVNSSAVSLDRVAEIVGLTESDRKERLIFHQVNICDEKELRKVFENSPTFHAAIHFAGLKVCRNVEPMHPPHHTRTLVVFSLTYYIPFVY